MAKKLKFKPTPAGIMFLSAIGVLLIAIIILTVVGVSRCKKNDDPTREPLTSAEPDESVEPSLEPVETPEETTPDPLDTPDPDDTADPSTSADPNETPPGETNGPGPIVITTPGSVTSLAPGATATATPNPYYTTPTSAMKRNAQKGYVSADSVNMRKTPSKNGTLVKNCDKITDITRSII